MISELTDDEKMLFDDEYIKEETQEEYDHS